MKREPVEVFPPLVCDREAHPLFEDLRALGQFRHWKSTRTCYITSQQFHLCWIKKRKRKNNILVWKREKKTLLVSVKDMRVVLRSICIGLHPCLLNWRPMSHDVIRPPSLLPSVGPVNECWLMWAKEMCSFLSTCKPASSASKIHWGRLPQRRFIIGSFSDLN